MTVTKITIRSRSFDIEIDHEHGGDAFMWGRLAEGKWERETFDAVEMCLTAGRRFIDVGAMSGAVSLFAASLCDEVHAYEADPIALRNLARNISLNPALEKRIHCHAGALWIESGTLRFFSNNRAGFGNSTSSAVITNKGNSIEVAAENVCEAYDREEWGRNAFIKMDVEGAEFRLLPALAGRLRRDSPPIYVSLHQRIMLDGGIERSAVGEQVEQLADALAHYKVLHVWRGRWTPYLEVHGTRQLSDVIMEEPSQFPVVLATN